ncbi:hypothetical protein D0866_08709 [Hortaea werneckii]|uniref:Heterokaryon incompatibility domain-containing protein n=1 Tax=Hortaea werneckii TaxID=91943 RepID=A0A3M7APD1_HORWE|nr:hypothetical protein D0866_08709 [Hortaea werneckii]
MADRLAYLPQERDAPLDRTVHDTDHSKYPYQPLNKESLGIRLLTIYPATDPSEVPVKCSLSHANLGKEPKPTYETISYAWGKSKERQAIVVDDFSLEVPVSAERAIRRMRLRDQKRLLWIDAICVNQADTNEKDHQVGMLARPDADDNMFSMAEIYCNTSQGLIWLGEADDSTEKALSSINAACAEACVNTKCFGDLYLEVIYGGSIGTFGFTPDFAALVRFFQLPWFDRRWVIQEALLAPSSQCIIGDLRISWANLLLGAVWLVRYARVLPGAQAASRLSAMWILSARKQAGWRISFNSIMTSTQGSKVEDERDTVYALLGLCLKLQHRRKLHPLLTPDYSKAPDAIVCDATRYMAVKDNNLFHLQFLNHRRNPDPREKKLPSWAASWHIARDLTRDPFQFFQSFHADGRDWRRHFRPPPEDSSRILSVRGKMMVHVRAVTEMINSNDTPGQVLAKLGQFEMAWSLCIQQASGLNNSSRLGNVLIAEKGGFWRPQEVLRWYAEWLKYLRRENSWPPASRTVNNSKFAAPREVAQYNENFWYACRNRVLFITEYGRLGVGP